MKGVRQAGGIAILLLSFGFAFAVIKYHYHVEHAMRTIGPWAKPLALVLFAIVASAPFSVTDALAVMNGSIFGPVWGSIINAVGIVLAGILGYWVNRRAQHLLDLEQTLTRLPSWVKRFPIGSPMFLLAVRVIPGLGGTVATATAAAFRVPVWVHVWTMSVIAIPICVLLAVFGDRLTVMLHSAEHRASAYYQHHHFHFHHRHHK